MNNVDRVYSIFGNLDISVNWIDYINGMKIYDLDEGMVEFNEQFTFGLLFKTATGFRPLMATTVDGESLL